MQVQFQVALTSGGRFVKQTFIRRNFFKMKIIFTTVSLVLLSFIANAQQAEDSIRTTIINLFTAMRNGDASLARSVFSDSALLQTLSRDKEGKTIVRTENAADFAQLVGTLKKDSADERISFETIRVDGPLAIVWTPYHFYYNGRFSHCGVNSFQLVRFEGVWKIQYLIDTRRRQGCNP